jgi:hypothetical protein
VRRPGAQYGGTGRRLERRERRQPLAEPGFAGRERDAASGVSLHTGALEAIERVLNRGGEADDVLRQVVLILHERLGHYVRISFVEADGLVPGPAVGDETGTTAFPIAFRGRRVADLEAGGELTSEDRALLERAATLVSPYALVGWDTGGEAWTP